jgi:peptidoglycan/LPS O-acetylase OafA/YrhL
MAAQYKPAANTTQDPNLDILRSVAVLAVFATHTLQVIAGCKFGEHLAYGIDTYAFGRIGVLLFFVHTSLVLMQSLERTATRGFCGSLTLQFYIRRIFRIYPLSICLILLSIAFSIPPNALNVPFRCPDVKSLLANLLLIQNMTRSSDIATPLWSLPYEVQMYLVLPILYLLLRASKGNGRLGLIYLNGTLLSLFYLLFRYVPCFLAGVIAYRLLRTLRPRLPHLLWCPTIIGVVALYTMTPYSDQSWSKDVFSCLAVGLLIPLFYRKAGIIATVASQIAKYSYGIYLCHTPVLWLLYRKLTIPDWCRVIGLVILTGVLSVACYHVIEHPLIQVGTRLSNRASTRLGRGLSFGSIQNLADRGLKPVAAISRFLAFRLKRCGDVRVP